MSPMKVALVYDDLSRLAPGPEDPLDVGSEWEDARTIAGQAAALAANGYTVASIPYDTHFFAALENERPDCVFNIAEGRRGKDRESIVPAICRSLDIPCTSSDAVGLGLSLDKDLCKHIAHAHGVPTPDWFVVRRIKALDSLALPFPLFVKPNFEGSSMGIRPDSIVRTAEQLRERVAWLLCKIGPALVETYMPGPELTVGLLGNDDPIAFPVAEVRTAGRVYDKTMKNKDKMEEEIVCPAPIAPESAGELVAWSKTLFHELGLAGMARFDFKCDAAGKPGFLEVNPLPGMSRYYSVFTFQAQAASLTYEQLIGRIVELALERRRK